MVASAFVFLVAGSTVPGFVLTDRKLASVGVWLNILDDLSAWCVSTSGARAYLCECHILSRRSGRAGGGDGGIGLAGFLLLRLFL